MISLIFMRDLECARSTIGQCVFVHITFHGEVRMTCIILLYVDDEQFVGDSSLAAELSNKFTKHFPTPRGGDDYLGYEIKADHIVGTVRATQKAFEQKVVEKYGFANCAEAPSH
jgi:hypothetical protein